MVKRILEMAKAKITKEKIYERNPSTGVIRWRYTNESSAKFGWPNYGRVLKQRKKSKVSNGIRKTEK
jgi:hypothetical protein